MALKATQSAASRGRRGGRHHALGMQTPPAGRCFTPPELAQRYKSKPSTIIDLIKSGELQAFNFAKPGSKRARWLIPPEAIEAFEQRRAVHPTPKVTAREPKLPAVKSFV